VHIDGAALPPLSPGDELTLIDIRSTGTTITSPLNSTGTFGGYDFQILIDNKNLIARILAVNYAIKVYETGTGNDLGPYDPYTFPSAVVGYGAQTPLDVTVENIGTNATGDLSITLSGADASDFTLSATTMSSLGIGATDTFTVVPNTGLSPGTYTATVTVGPDALNTNPVAPISFEISFTVEKEDTSIAVVSSLNPSVYGQSVTFTATVTVIAPGTGTPTGDVIFYDGIVEIGRSALNASGVATLTTSTLIVGNHPITVSYEGDANCKPSDDLIGVVQVVNKADTNITLTSSLNPSNFGDNVTFTATLSVVPPGGGTPTGNVNFYNNGVLMGSSPLGAAGTATFSISTLSIGTHPITAEYAGDTNFNPSTSSILDQVVQAAPSGKRDYYITATSDGSSTISPEGVTVVKGGTNQSFRFSALEGYLITAVLVDGKPISQAEVDLGIYTFRNVNANHTIDVFSRGMRTDITLVIEVMQGSGYAEYSINGGPFIRYTAVVTLREYDNVTAVAYGTNGSEFIEWREGGRIFIDEAVTLTHIAGPVYLELYFTEGKGDKGFFWWWIIVVIALILGFLWWFLFYYRRSYDVIKVSHTAEIVGKDRVRRKRAYTFKIEGGPAIPVSYRIGNDDDAPWKILSPDPATGEYKIPRGEITDDVTIEYR
jgi:hypothetical protein